MQFFHVESSAVEIFMVFLCGCKWFSGDGEGASEGNLS